MNNLKSTGPAGDAGLERQTCEVCREIDRLQAQLAVQQAVVDAARWVITETRRAEHARCGKSCIWRGLIDSLAALDNAQAAQPEGER